MVEEVAVVLLAELDQIKQLEVLAMELDQILLVIVHQMEQMELVSYLMKKV